jgi:glutathione peroxidase
MTTIYDFTARALSGEDRPICEFSGKVLLIVNTASKCGFTPQYKGLEALHREYGPQGFEVLGFPCNQFGAQEPGDAAEIASFCSVNYGVSFPIFAKIEVNGRGAHPLYVHLKREKPGQFSLLGLSLLGLGDRESIKWNFTKFLVDRRGLVKERFSPMASPESLRGAIERLLQAP